MIPVMLATILIFAAACGTKNHPVSEGALDDTKFGKEDYKKVVSANNELGFKLLEEIETDENGNSFISPTSLLMALSMVYNGADGVTKEEIATVLQLEGIEKDELNKANASMLSILQKDSDQIQLNVANSIWINDRFHFQDEFAQQNKDYFNAAIEVIDVADKKSPKLLNDWVKASTNDKIVEIVNEDVPFNHDLVAYLVNAIYFKGDWMYAFDKEQTTDSVFQLEDGTTKDILLMALYEELAYMENEDFQAVALPYGDGKMSMTVFLPREALSLEQFKQMLTQENWEKWQLDFHKKDGTILLPKFQLEYEVLLNDTLQKLGIRSAFDEGADFTKMIQEADPIWISKVQQNTFIDVDEEGTEAAAATTIEVVTESAKIDTPFYMEVNRPFFIAITDDETGTILFMGTIANPIEK